MKTGQMVGTRDWRRARGHHLCLTHTIFQFAFKKDTFYVSLLSSQDRDNVYLLTFKVSIKRLSISILHANWKHTWWMCFELPVLQFIANLLCLIL